MMAGTSAAASRDAVDRAVDEVFADPALRDGLTAGGGGLSDVLFAVLTRAQELLRRVIESLQWLHATSPFIFWTIFVLLFLVLIALLIHIGWTVSLAFLRTTASGPEPSEKEGEARRRRSLEILDEARGLAAAGLRREALRALLLAILALAEERRILRIARGWTHREIASRLSVPPHLRGDLFALERSVEAAWYGSVEVTDVDYQRCEETAQRLLRNFATRPAGEHPSTSASAATLAQGWS